MAVRSPISTLLLPFLATLASLYVAGRLWQDAEIRVYLAKELDRITGQVKIYSWNTVGFIDECEQNVIYDHMVSNWWTFILGKKSDVSRRFLEDHTMQQKKLSDLDIELAAARQEGFVSKHLYKTNKTPQKRQVVVIGILTGFGLRNKRDAIRQTWMGTGASLKKMEDQKGVIVRFVIGRSSTRGDSLDRSIDNENKQTNDIFVLENHVEAPEELPNKTKLFFAHAAERWDADFYAKINDDVYVNVDALRHILASHFDKPRVYIGCMKSGEVFNEQGHKWFEPDWWKFGDEKTYFRHASGEMFVISQALARFISINRSILRSYAHDDVTVGSWFIGVDVQHIDEKKLCCAAWSTGSVCSGV